MRRSPHLDGGLAVRSKISLDRVIPHQDADYALPIQAGGRPEPNAPIGHFAGKFLLNRWVMSGICGKVASFISATILVLVAGTTLARADIAHFYLATSCDLKRGVATITDTIVYNDGPAPPNSTHYGDNGGFLLIPHNKIGVCDLGIHRNISLLIWMNGDHPRDDHMDIYIGTRPPLSVYDIPSEITITSLPENFFVTIKQCPSSKPCSKRRFTNPSFDCQKASGQVEMLICSSDKLSQLDVSLESVWQGVLGKLHVSGKPADHLKSEEILWIKQRAALCRLPTNDNPYFSLDGAQKCLQTLYENRIRQLKDLDKPS